jgi:hypothetical protein
MSFEKYNPAKLPPSFAFPMIKAAHPEDGADCLCCWAYSARITGDENRPWFIKTRNSFCPMRHREEITPQDEPESVLSLFDAIQVKD